MAEAGEKKGFWHVLTVSGTVRHAVSTRSWAV